MQTYWVPAGLTSRGTATINYVKIGQRAVASIVVNRQLSVSLPAPSCLSCEL